jgi:deoxycytidine triphosphate deaminase
MRTLARSLRAGVEYRAEALLGQVLEAMRGIADDGSGLATSLRLYELYALELPVVLGRDWDRAGDEVERETLMRSWSLHLNDRAAHFDIFFGRHRTPAPQSLASSLNRLCNQMSLPNLALAVSIGDSTNFQTFTGNLGARLFEAFGYEPEGLAEIVGIEPVMIAVPSFEGNQARWQPVTAGHEIFHYLRIARPLAEVEALADQVSAIELPDPTLAATGVRIKPITHRDLLQIATRWYWEVACDAFAVLRFGAAGVTAMTEFLNAVGANHHLNTSHPPGDLRAELMLGWLGSAISEPERDIVAPYKDTQLAFGATEDVPDWFEPLCDALRSVSEDIWRSVLAWSPIQPYAHRNRGEIIRDVADYLAGGVPGHALLGIDACDVDEADIVNGAWLALPENPRMPIDRLALKALDSLDLLHKWTDSGGAAWDDGPTSGELHPGCLEGDAIRERMARSDAFQLVVTPRLPNTIGGASLDVRLGNRFIVFERSKTGEFDSLNEKFDPSRLQSAVERSWGDVFYLHPNELVLAATLEYFVLPGDLTALVTTRSSYGRLGLISATAVQVHPHFAGCLTLELVNLGAVPMAITPGERVAQLSFFSTTNTVAAAAEDTKYMYPTGPEFSKIRTDSDTAVLRQMRQRFASRTNQQPQA